VSRDGELSVNWNKVKCAVNNGQGDLKMNPSSLYLREVVVPILCTVFLLATAHAASFDCGKAASEVEKLICGNEELSRLDESLNKAYLKALERPDIRKQMIESQRQWLKNERNACKNAECLKKAYETRIKELGLSSYGIVIESPPHRTASPPESAPNVSESQPTEPHGKVVDTEPGQQHRSTTAPVNDSPVVSKPRKRTKEAEKQRTSFVEHGNIAFELEFESFEKQKDSRDEPFAFSSTEAEKLWTFRVSREPGLKKEPENMVYGLGSFAKLGSDSYLIQDHAFFYAQPKQNILTELTAYLPPGNYSLGEIRRLGKDNFWLLLSGANYKHDVGSQIYYALIFEQKPDNSFAARSAYISSFEFRGSGLCGDNDEPDSWYPRLESAEYVDDVMVRDVNRDGKDDVVFHTTEQNCETKKTRKRQRTFLNMGDSFIEKGAGATIFYLDENYLPVVKLERLGPLSDGMRAILAMYALQNGAGCSGGNENIRCSLNDALNLGGQCSKEHVNLIRTWFRQSIPKMDEYGDDVYKNIQTPGDLEAICYRMPDGAAFQNRWDIIRVTQNEDHVTVDAHGKWLAREKTGSFRYLTEYRINKDSVTVISHKEIR
jgi:uncharacterized protein